MKAPSSFYDGIEGQNDGGFIMPIHQRRISLITSMVIYALLFIIIALNYKKMLNVDKWVQSYLYDSLGTIGDFVFILITYIGSSYVLLPVMGILICVFLFQKRYW